MISFIFYMYSLLTQAHFNLIKCAGNNQYHLCFKNDNESVMMNDP